MALPTGIHYLLKVKPYFLVLLVIFCFAGESIGQNGLSPRPFVSIKDVVSGWSPANRFWILGQLPVSPSNLSSLGTWLEQNAPNWTVVLLQNARSEGMDAVELALGEGLSNQTGFGSMIDTRVNEPNGAVFVLFLEERKFSYFGSEVFDKRGLGESMWIGKLDKPAIEAMRNGGRIGDSIKNTITSIETSLTKAIEQEREATRRESIEKEAKIEEARLLPKKMEARISALQDRSAVLRSQNPDFRGELAYPKDSDWLASVKAVALYAEGNDYEKAHANATSTLLEIDYYEEALNQWENGPRELAERAERFKRVPGDSPAPKVAGQLSLAAASLESAQRNHRYGDTIYLEQIALVDHALTLAASENAAYLAEKEADHQQQLAQEAKAKHRKIRNQSFGGGLGAILIGWLTLLNRKRRRTKDEAEQTYQDWRRKLRGKFDQLFDLMDRTSVIKRVSENFTAVTATLTTETVKEVDQLFIMSSATDRVMENVVALIDPRTPWGKAINCVSMRNFRKAIDLMSSKAIGFDKSEGLRSILKTGNQTKTRVLLGDEKDYAPFSISFKQLISAFDERQAAVTSKLDRLETCIDGLPMLIEKGGQTIENLSHELSETDDASQSDGYFHFDTMQEKLLPETDRLLRATQDLGKSDPVSAMEGPASQAERILADATNLVSSIVKARAILFPVISKATEQLEAKQLATQWITNAFQQYTAEVETISQAALTQSSAERIDDLNRKMAATGERVQQVVDLATRMTIHTPSALSNIENKIFATRSEIANQLNLNSDDILNEEAKNPAIHLESCREALKRVTRNLSNGNIESAKSEFEQIDHSIREAEEFITESRNMAANGHTQFMQMESELKALQESLPSISKLLDEMTTEYPAEILLLKERFGSEVPGLQNLGKSIETAEDHVSNLSRFIADGWSLFNTGKLIAAGNQLEKAANEANLARHQLKLIEDHHVALKKTEALNQSEIADLILKFRASISKNENQKTRQSTINKRKAIGQHLEEVSNAISTPQHNPFQISRDNEELKRQFLEFEEAVKIDWEWHRTATKEATEAQAVLDSTESLILMARNDGITDSRKLQSAITNHGQLERKLLDWQVYLAGANRDWETAYHGVIEIESDATKIKGIIENELQAANAAAQNLQLASQAISELKNLPNNYQIPIDRDTGDTLFYASRQALADGDYLGSSANSAAAINQIQTAIASARSMEQRIRAEEETIRRRRAASASDAAVSSRMRNSSSAGAFTIRSSSSSNSRSSSGGRGSTGSGFSRSGW